MSLLILIFWWESERFEPSSISITVAAVVVIVTATGLLQLQSIWKADSYLLVLARMKSRTADRTSQCE
jgi:hypothetical protein